MNFQFEKAFKILIQTLPFVLLRLGVYLAAMAVAVGWWVGIFFLFTNWPFPGPPWLAWVLGGVLFGGGAKLVKQYVLYLVRAGHVLVITRLAVSGELPKGTTQFSYAATLVFNHFLRVSLLFAADRLVHLVLKTFNRSVFSLLGAVPGVGGFRKFFQTVLDYSAGYVDEAVLSYSLLYPERNPWNTARDGLVLYVQNWRTILGSGLILAAASYVLVGAIAAPAALISFLAGGAFKPMLVGGAVGLGLLLKFAIMDPFALASVIVNFHSAIEGQIPDPEWDRKLTEMSDQFGEIKTKAEEWGLVSEAAVPPPPPKTNPT